jgi:hypothetical protein
LAIVNGGTVLGTAHGVSAWAPLVSTARLRRSSPSCGVTTLNAVAIAPDGATLVATGCARGGVVGLFARAAGAWQPSGVVLHGPLAGSSTSVIRLQTTPSITTALVAVIRGGRRFLIAMWRSGNSAWRESTSLSLEAGQPFDATALDPNGDLAVLLGAKSGLVAEDIPSGGSWRPLPAPPPRTVALAPISSPAGPGGPAFDAFTVRGTRLGVFAPNAAGTGWMMVQSSQVELAYGSSS